MFSQQAVTSFSRRSAWLIVGQAAIAVAQSAVLIILARRLGPTALGEYGLAAAIVAPTIAFFSFNLRGLAATDVNGAFSEGEYRLLQRAASVPSVLVALVSALALYGSLASLPAVLLLWAQRNTEQMSELAYGTAQRDGRVRVIARGMILRAVVSVIAVALFVWHTGRVEAALAGALTANVAVLMLHDRRIYSSSAHQDLLQWRGAWRALRVRLLPLATLGVRYGSLAVVPALTVAIPRWVLGRDDLAAVGYFTALAHAPAILGLVAVAVGHAIMTPLARAGAEGRIEDVRLILRAPVLALLALGGLAVVAAVVLGKWALVFVYGASFGEFQTEFVMLTWIGLLQMLSTPAAFALSAWRCINVQERNSAVIAALTIASTLTLVPHYGLWGACLAMLATSSVKLLLYWWSVFREVRRPRAIVSRAAVT